MADTDIRTVGNITREPELRFTTGGMQICSFGIATNHRYKNKAGEWAEEVTFWDVTAFGDLAEYAAYGISKGDRVMVHGRYKTDEWVDAKGEKRRKVVIIADDIGASIRFARVTVERVSRDRSDARRQAPDEPVYGDEEPF